ncbi:hypothetical protein DM860_011697 [Cuscuta australis]|uniref:DUF4378 domain-containing protein n=1 Tax=Cuscuta australis TaxID=267555 RepID=A0A328DGQ6_9ASTE|nr:hypothetical protein DM860_011697 [Cuscuta australis]
MKPARANPSPGTLLLKDHLVEDVSSCSSNGFRSYPRRECCTTVRFLLEADLRDVPTRRPAAAEHPAVARRAAAGANRAPTSGVVSALQRASKTVIKAVRNLHIAPAAAAVKSERQSKAKKPILPANFSRKLLKRNVNKKQIDRSEIERWKVYNQLAQEISKPSDSNSSSSNSRRNSDSTVSGDSQPSSSYSSEGNSTVAQNDAVAAKSSPAEKAVRNRPSVRVTNAYRANKQKQLWSIPTCNVEKEQSSPVSVLDYPLEEDDEASSPLQTKLNIEPETMKKLLRKIKRFESLTQIEAPPKPEPPLRRSSLSPTPKPDDQSRVERNAKSLLLQLKCPPISDTDTSLLLDFFRCGMAAAANEGLPVSELVRQAEGWVSGECSRFWGEWEVEKNRRGYIEVMEKEWKWERVMGVENGELAMELERYVSSSLVNELVADLLTSSLLF